MIITVHAILIWIVAILIGSLDLVIFMGSNNLSSRAFTHSILWVVVWVTTVGFFVTTISYEKALFFSRLTFFLGTIIASSFLYFFVTYPDDARPSKTLTLLLFVIEMGFLYESLFTNNIVSNLVNGEGWRLWDWEFGNLSFIFDSLFFGLFFIGVIILARKLKTLKERGDTNARKNLIYMLWVILVGAVPPGILCVVLPHVGVYQFSWLGPVSEIIWIPIIAYSIIRYRQMSVKAVATEVLAVGMTIIFFVNIFLGISFGIIGRIITFVVFTFMAIYLLRMLLVEAEQREQLRSLNQHLEDRVAEQTAEIRHAFALEKKARHDLEKLNDTKDQFIMITQHHLRTPVTNIRWELEAISKGDFGKISPEMNKAIASAGKSVSRLTALIDDFLNITAIKSGTNILNITKRSLLPAIEEVINETAIDRKRMNIDISYPKLADKWPVLEIDYDKIRECLLIVVENAIKYNIPNGRVEISTKISDKQFEITIFNTGIGMNKEEAEKVGTSLFFRGEVARQANPIGMGIGLSVVKAIIKAHHGSIIWESRGRGEGVKVKIVLVVD